MHTLEKTQSGLTPTKLLKITVVSVRVFDNRDFLFRQPAACSFLCVHKFLQRALPS
jgi:hypothetical protein